MLEIDKLLKNVYSQRTVHSILTSNDTTDGYIDVSNNISFSIP